MIRSFEFERYSTSSFFSKLNAMTKMIFLSSLTLVLILIDHYEVLLIINILIYILFIFSKLSFRLITIGLTLSLLNIYSLMLSQGLFYDLQPRTLFWDIMTFSIFNHEISIQIWSEGIIYGLKSSLRLNAPFLISYLLFFTTSPHEILTALKRLKIHDGLSIMLLTALRFIPFVFENYQIIRTSQKLKGYSFSFKKPIQSLKTEFKLLIPVFFSSLRNAKLVSLSMIGRQVNFTSKRQTIYKKLSFKDMLLIQTMIAFLVILFLFKIVYWIYIYNIFYMDSLRPIYHFTRMYL